MTCSWWLAALLALYQLGSSCCYGYSISVINCDRPRNVKVYDFKSLCPTPLDPPKNTRKWVLLQQLKETIVKGVRCKVTKSTFRGYCGRWSHFKMASVPTIEHNEDIPAASCAYAARELKYVDESGTEFSLSMNAVNNIQNMPLGSITDDGNVYCEGQAGKIGPNIVDSLMIMQSIKYTLQEEEYLIKGDTIEIRSTQSVLPCSASSGSCETSSGTYTWEQPNSCALARIRMFEGIQRSTWWIDQSGGLIINETGRAPDQLGCQNTRGFRATNYPGIFLGSMGTYSDLPSVDVDPFIETRSKIDYSNYLGEQRTSKLKATLATSVCENLRQIQFADDTLFKVYEGDNDLVYARATGESVHVVTCNREVAPIVASDHCANKIRVRSSLGMRWVDPITRLMSEHATTVPCNNRFPFAVETLQGWVGIYPQIRPLATPAKFPTTNEPFKHQQAGTGGIYTSEEMEAWSDLISFPTYRRELTNQLAAGTCDSAQGTCSGETGATNMFDLSRIRPKIADIHPWKYINSVLKEYSTYISLIVILGWTLQVIVYLVTIIYTYITGGMAGMIAVTNQLLCFSWTTQRKVRARAVRAQRISTQESQPTPEQESLTLHHLENWGRK